MLHGEILENMSIFCDKTDALSWITRGLEKSSAVIAMASVPWLLEQRSSYCDSLLYFSWRSNYAVTLVSWKCQDFTATTCVLASILWVSSWTWLLHWQLKQILCLLPFLGLFKCPFMLCHVSKWIHTCIHFLFLLYYLLESKSAPCCFPFMSSKMSFFF